jgi:uncharacterized membrane protein YraQ (UPF0718 family)
MFANLAGWLGEAAPVFFSTFTGLAFETLPFLALGTLLSSAIHVLIPSDRMRRLFPRDRTVSIIAALFVGTLLPVCECGTVPVARSLRQKGLPVSTAAAFLLSAPLVNPITILSTVAAFHGSGRPVFLYRLAFGIGAAFLVALLVDRRPPITIEVVSERLLEEAPGDRAAPRRENSGTGVVVRKLGAILEHTSHDFLDIARYLVMGITAASLLRAVVPADAVTNVSHSVTASAALGLVLAYVLSLCSAADAFVARSLLSGMPFPATIAFLLLGPMIDVKNTLLLSRHVKASQLAIFLLMIFAVDFTAALAAGYIAGGWT